MMGATYEATLMGMRPEDVNLLTTSGLQTMRRVPEQHNRLHPAYKAPSSLQSSAPPHFPLSSSSPLPPPDRARSP
nr:unnamed protein product [Digitaria exilis]